MRRLELPLLLLAAAWLPACDGLGQTPAAQSVARRAVDSMVEPAWASAVEANPDAVADVAEAASATVTVVVVVDSVADVASAIVAAEEVHSGEEAAALVIAIAVAVALETEAASEAVEETVVGSGNRTESSPN